MKLTLRRNGSSLAWLLILLPAAILALILGAGTAILPKVLVAGAGALMVLAPVYVLRPAWLLAPVVLFQMYFPSQPVADVVSVLLLARAFPTLAHRWNELRPMFANVLVKPLLAIGLFAVLSFAVAITILHRLKSPVYQDGRVFVYWLWVVAFIAWAPAQKPEVWLVRQVLMVACVVAALAVVQGAFGITLVSTGRVAQLENLGHLNADFTRVQIAGFVFVTFGIFYCTAKLIGDSTVRGWSIYLPLMVLFVMAVVFNFGRAIWFWTVLGIAITAIALGWRALAKVTFLAITVTLLAGTVLLWAKPRIADVIVERIASVSQEGGGRSSYGWREVENDSARHVLRDSLGLGTGLGGDYRQVVVGLTAFENHTRYIHNGHLSLMLKLSIFGYIGYLVLFALILRQSIRLRRHAAFGSMAVATTAWTITFLGQNITQPDIMTAHGLTMLAAAVAGLLLTGGGIANAEMAKPANDYMSFGGRRGAAGFGSGAIVSPR